MISAWQAFLKFHPASQPSSFLSVQKKKPEVRASHTWCGDKQTKSEVLVSAMLNAMKLIKAQE